jgi:hypothetical protein
MGSHRGLIISMYRRSDNIFVLLLFVMLLIGLTACKPSEEAPPSEATSPQPKPTQTLPTLSEDLDVNPALLEAIVEVEDRLPFSVRGPTRLPAMWRFVGHTLDETSHALTLNFYVDQGDEGQSSVRLVQQWSPGSGLIAAPSIPSLPSEAIEQPARVGLSAAVYIEGDSTDGGWSPDELAQRLRWRVDDVVFELQNNGKPLGQSLMERVARNVMTLSSMTSQEGYGVLPELEQSSTNIRLEMLEYLGGHPGSLAVSTHYAYVMIGSELRIFDLSTLEDIHEVGSLLMPGQAHRLKIFHRRLYALVGPTLLVIDVSDPFEPVVETQIQVNGEDTTSSDGDLVVSDGYLYAGAGHSWLMADLASAEEIRVLRRGTTDLPVLSIEVAGVNLYLGEGACSADRCEGSLEAVDISDPIEPRTMAHQSMPSKVQELLTYRNWLYAVYGGCDWYVESSPKCDLVLQTFNTSSDGDLAATSENVLPVDWISEAVIDSGWLSLIEGRSLLRFSLEDPSKPRLDVQGTVDTYLSDFDVVDGRVYFSTSDGLMVADSSDSGELVPIADHEFAPAIAAMDVIGNVAYVAYSSAEKTTFRVIDLFNPVAPKALSDLVFDGYARDLVASGDHAYLRTQQCTGVNECTASLFVIEISSPEAPREVARLVNAFGGAVIIGRNMVVEGNWLYLADENNLWLVDVADPSSPQISGHYETFNFYISDITPVGDLVFLAGLNGIQAVDVSNSESPVRRRIQQATMDTSWAATKSLDGLLYVVTYSYSDEKSALWAVTIDDPLYMEQVALLLEGGSYGGPYALTVEAGKLYLFAGDHLQIYTIEDSTNLDLVASFGPLHGVWKIDVEGDRVYVQDWIGGISILRFIMH